MLFILPPQFQSPTISLFPFYQVLFPFSVIFFLHIFTYPLHPLGSSSCPFLDPIVPCPIRSSIPTSNLSHSQFGSSKHNLLLWQAASEMGTNGPRLLVSMPSWIPLSFSLVWT